MLNVGTCMFERGMGMELLSPFPARSLLWDAVGSSDQVGCMEQVLYAIVCSLLLRDLQHVPKCLCSQSVQQGEKLFCTFSGYCGDEYVSDCNELTYWNCGSYISI